MKMVDVNEQRQPTVTGALTGAMSGTVLTWAIKTIMAAVIVLALCAVPFLAMGWFSGGAIAGEGNHVPTIAERYGQNGAASFNDAKQHCGPEEAPRATVYADGSFAGWKCVDVTW